MTVAKAQTVLRRKAEAGRPQADSAPMTATRALTISLAKNAQDTVQMPLRVAEITETRMTLADLPETLEPLSLLAIMEGPGEALGLIGLPPATLSALIEIQTMGRISPNAPSPRKPTRIDASMAAELLDKVMEGFEELLAEHADVTWAGGFRYASFLDDPRPLGLLLEDVSFRVYRIKLLLGPSGEREGGMILALPAQGRGRGPRKAGESKAEAEATAAGGVAAVDPQIEAAWAQNLEATVLGTRADLTAVLHRATMSLAQVIQFKVGMTIPVPYAALEDLRIEGIGRQKVGAARLGQAQGMRALRIRLEVDGEQDEAQGFATHAATPSAAQGARQAAFDAMSEGDLTGFGGGLAEDFAANRPAFESDAGSFGGVSFEGEIGELPDLDNFPALEDLPPLKMGGM